VKEAVAQWEERRTIETEGIQGEGRIVSTSPAQSLLKPGGQGGGSVDQQYKGERGIRKKRVGILNSFVS